MEGIATLAIIAALYAPAASRYVDDRPHWIAEGFVGRSMTPILGSEDERNLAGLAIHHLKDFPLARNGRYRADLGTGLYIQQSHSEGIARDPANTVNHIGVMNYVRWSLGNNHRAHAFLDVGMGLHLSSKRTYDLDSRLSSTPFLGVGLAVPRGKQELTVTLRFVHISNANTTAKNYGQNQLWASLGVRF